MTDYTFRSLGEALQQAYAFREQKRLDDAFTIAKKCLELAPNEPDVHSLMGVLSHDKKNFFESEKAFTTAITLRPENADYYFYLGQLLLEQKRFQEAENIYHKQYSKLSFVLQPSFLQKGSGGNSPPGLQRG